MREGGREGGRTCFKSSLVVEHGLCTLMVTREVAVC